MSAATDAVTKERTSLKRWAVRVLLFVGGLVGLAWAAPMIAAYTPLVSWACREAEKHVAGHVHVGTVSLGWFSPVVLTNVEIRDAGERTIVQIPRIASDRCLLRLLMDRDDFGSFRLEKPKIDITYAGQESGLEKILARYWPEAGHAAADGEAMPFVLPQLQLEVVDAVLAIHDADTKQSWKMHGITLNAFVFDEAGKTVQLTLQGALHDGVEAGTLKAEVRLDHVLEPSCKATIKARFSSFPLALTNVFTRRYQPGTHLAGSLQGHCTISAEMKAGAPHVEIAGEFTGNHVILRSPLLADQLYLERIKAPVSLRIEARKLIAQKLEVETDFGNLSMHGTFDFGEDLLAVLDQPDFDLAIEVNLATAAERLPKTLHLHRDLRLTSGQLNVRCKSHGKNDQIIWHGKLNTTGVRGLKGNQAIAWAEPIALEFHVRNITKGIPLIDQLKCSARFLKVEGSQVDDHFRLTLEADLQQLAEPLGQFVDLEAMKLGGKANGTITVRRGAKDQFLVQGEAQLRHVNWSWFTSVPWQEELVTAKFDARCQLGPHGQQRIEAGNVDVNVGGDRVTMKLIEPIADLAARPWGTTFVRAEGDLTRWQRRARCWTTLLDDCQFAGAAGLQMQIRPTRQAVECLAVDFHASRFRCTGANLRIQEPTLQVQTAARWDAKTGAVELTQTKLTCSAMQAAAETLSLQPRTIALRGAANISGNIAKVRQWLPDANVSPGEPMEGAFAGRVDLQTTEERLTADFKCALHNFLYGPIAQPTWRETEVRCVGRGFYEPAREAFCLEKISVVSSMLKADAAGTIANFTTTRDVDLSGTLAYDLAKMEPQLRPLLGKDVKIAGRDVRTFKLAGPLFPTNPAKVLAVSVSPARLQFTGLKGEANLHWKSLKALGCDVGPAEVKAVMQHGWFQLYPIDTSLNGGKLHMQPNLRLEPTPVEMVLLAGPMIENAKITPEMCAGALGYLLPLLANVPEAEGTISLSLEGGRIPLAAPATAEVKGTFVLHSAKVPPNALIRELSSLLKIPPPTSIVKETRVPFHLLNGKVHHSNFELAFPEFTIRSSGAVGLDGTLALVVEMPIPPALAAAARLTPAQAKQTLRIPIGGTLEHPRPDARALESLTSVLGRTLLENELNKLLQPRR